MDNPISRRTLHRLTLYALLRELRGGPKSWTELERTAIKAGATSTTFRTVLERALEEGDIQRPERGIYRLTERGLKTLEYLKSIKISEI